MKVKYADRIYTVSSISEIGGITLYGIEDEPNHIDWGTISNASVFGIVLFTFPTPKIT